MIDEFDPLKTERDQLDLLIEKGVEFTVQKRSLLRFWGKPERLFLIQQPYLGTLDFLSREFIDMDFSEDRLKRDVFGESKHLIARNALRCSRIVAIAVLNSAWKIKWLTGLYSYYFRWRVTPQKLWQLTMIINSISNLADFTNSIRYLSVQMRTAAPALMEKTPAVGD